MYLWTGEVEYIVCTLCVCIVWERREIKKKREKITTVESGLREEGRKVHLGRPCYPYLTPVVFSGIRIRVRLLTNPSLVYKVNVSYDG